MALNEEQKREVLMIVEDIINPKILDLRETLRSIQSDRNFTNLQQLAKPMEFFKSLRFQYTTPAEIGANQNNYDSGDIPVLRLSSDASRNITGFKNPTTGRFLIVLNVGSNDIVLMDEDTNSSAENRIITHTGADITLGANDGAILWYDVVSARWRLFINS